MKFDDIKYKKYKFPLKNHLRISNQTISYKDVIILKIKDEFGKHHYGEVSPLNGFSIENIDDCEKKLIEIKNNYSHVSLGEQELRDCELSKSPSLLFGIEQLLLSISASTKTINEKTIKINALVGICSKLETLNKVDDFIKKGYSTIKLKIGNSKFSDDLEMIKSIHHKYYDKIKLRLDNNGNWKLEEALKNIELLSDYNIEYLEQPVNSTKDLIKLSEMSKIPIAADESVTNLEDSISLIENGNIKFLVLKPSIRLGVHDSERVIEKAKLNNIAVIITSAFETAIGKSLLLYLASLGRINFAHGLSTELVGEDCIKSDINYNSHDIKFDNSSLFTNSICDF